jgi:hypothetical protein
VVSANAAAPGQWKDWWVVCVVGELVFVPFIWVMAGRWSPRKAREDAEAHDQLIQRELAALEQQALGNAAGLACGGRGETRRGRLSHEKVLTSRSGIEKQRALRYGHTPVKALIDNQE